MSKFIKRILFSLLAISAISVYAEVEDPNVMIIHYLDGTTNQIKIETIDHLEFAKVEDQGGPIETPATDPKVGDYFYSDGTWSDGGLISIDPDGRNAVWAETKPAPIAGKTVVGIVFTTNTDRIADTEKNRGFNHGYVIACKNITDPGKSNYNQYPESVWFAGFYAKADVNSVAKTAKTCYENINGYTETMKMIQENEPQYYDEDIPMFYYGTAPQYPVEAPANTSGWFIPSVGQMWDCVANFCSGEVAEFLASIRESTADFTYSSKNDLSESPFKSFMKVFELVPAEDKDEITIPDNGSTSLNHLIELATSSRYDEESRVVINLGMEENTLVEGMAAWFDEEAHARPILAF